MREVKLCAIIFAFALAMLFIRQGMTFSLTEMLPFGSDRPFDTYDLGSLVVIAVTITTVVRIFRKTR